MESEMFKVLTFEITLYLGRTGIFKVWEQKTTTLSYMILNLNQILRYLSCSWVRTAVYFHLILFKPNTINDMPINWHLTRLRVLPIILIHHLQLSYPTWFWAFDWRIKGWNSVGSYDQVQKRKCSCQFEFKTAIGRCSKVGLYYWNV